MMTAKPDTEIRQLLRNIALFSGLSAAQLDTLACSTCTRQVGRGQVIYRSGEPANDVHYLLSGHVKRTTEPQSHDDKVLDLIYPGQLFGEMEFIAARPRTSFAIAVEPSQLLTIGGRALQEILHSKPALALHLLTHLAQRQLNLETGLLATRALDGSQRLIDYLLRLGGGLSTTESETLLRLPSSKRLIAAHLGMTPETFSRSLRALSDQRLVIVTGRNIRLQNAALRHHLPAEFAPQPTPFQPHAIPAATDQPPVPHQLPTAINKAGWLRMLSQRMAKSWLMTARNIMPQQARRILQQSIRMFEQQLEEIATFGRNERIDAALVAVHDTWQPYRTLLESPPQTNHAVRLFQLNEHALEATQSLTEAFEHTLATPENHLINLAGRERMLSQHMAKLYMLLDWEGAGINRARCRKELHHAMDEFETVLQQFSSEVDAQPKIREQVRRVANQWQKMRDALHHATPQDLPRLTGTICTFSEHLLRKMDAAVMLYEKKLTA